MTNQQDSSLFDCAHTNPAPWFFNNNNGSLLLAFNAGFCHDNIETIGIAFAPHWSGPYTITTLAPIFPGPSNTSHPHSCEDPFLYEDERGFHLIGHDMSGNLAFYAHSFDAYDWVCMYLPINMYVSTRVFAFSSLVE
jgi:hypothetical protein